MYKYFYKSKDGYSTIATTLKDIEYTQMGYLPISWWEYYQVKRRLTIALLTGLVSVGLLEGVSPFRLEATQVAFLLGFLLATMLAVIVNQ